MQQKEYRYFDLELEGEEIRTRPFDFGCSCVMQDLLATSKDDPELNTVEKFISNIVHAILYRMLEGKVTHFNVVNTLDLNMLSFLFSKFNQWYTQDLEYLGKVLKAANPGNIKTGEEDESGDSSFFAMGYSIADGKGCSPEEVLGYRFETVAEMLHYAEKKRLQEHFKEHPIY